MPPEEAETKKKRKAWCPACGKETDHYLRASRKPDGEPVIGNCVQCMTRKYREKHPRRDPRSWKTAEGIAAYCEMRQLAKARWRAVIEWLTQWDEDHPGLEEWYPSDIPVGVVVREVPIHFKSEPFDLDGYMGELAAAFIERGFDDPRIDREPPYECGGFTETPHMVTGIARFVTERRRGRPK